MVLSNVVVAYRKSQPSISMDRAIEGWPMKGTAN
jgi:hypothetical protein